jgi:hypothetical protein
MGSVLDEPEISFRGVNLDSPAKNQSNVKDAFGEMDPAVAKVLAAQRSSMHPDDVTSSSGIYASGVYPVSARWEQAAPLAAKQPKPDRSCGVCEGREKPAGVITNPEEDLLRMKPYSKVPIDWAVKEGEPRGQPFHEQQNSTGWTQKATAYETKVFDPDDPGTPRHRNPHYEGRGIVQITDGMGINPSASTTVQYDEHRPNHEALHLDTSRGEERGLVLQLLDGNGQKEQGPGRYTVEQRVSNAPALHHRDEYLRQQESAGIGSYGAAFSDMCLGTDRKPVPKGVTHELSVGTSVPIFGQAEVPAPVAQPAVPAGPKVPMHRQHRPPASSWF